MARTRTRTAGSRETLWHQLLLLSWGLAACSGTSTLMATDAGSGGSGTGASGGASSGGGAATGGAAAGGAATGGGETGGATTGGAPSGGSAGSAGASGGCTNSVDCAARTDGKLVCDVGTGSCVVCVSDGDCGKGTRCVANACAVLPCTTSLDCPSGRVCDVPTQRCVDCVTNLDCAVGDSCVGNTCRPPCKSDKDCTPLGMLCNAAMGSCVDCVLATDCAVAEYCNAGVCVPDVCAAGTSDCQNNAVVTCNSDGSGTLSPVACGSTQTCVHTGTTATCVDQVCSPLVKACTNTEQVIQCSADGLGQSVLQDCGASGQVCVAATCKPVVCTAGAKFCSGAEVRQCSPKGDGSVLVATCDLTKQFCNSAAPACTAQVCTPNQPACNGTVATTCNADGSGTVSGGVDCASSGLHCVGGACKSVICVANSPFCANGTIQLCSADGTSSTTTATCTATQYCDPVSVTCKAQICSPNQPTCNGNAVTTCNTDGSGYTSTGTSCGTQYCVSGKCQAALFFEDWEDGDYAGWSIGTDSYTRSVTTAQAANGTLHSLVQTGGGSHQQGLYRTFTNMQPAAISWWAMPTTTSLATTYFVLTSGGSSTTYLFWAYFNSGGTIATSHTQTVTTPYSANQWYHLELRNINWTAHTYDWYVNGALVQASASFYTTTVSGVTRVDLYNFNSSTAYWDEIGFQ